jgi:DNA adenine methylase
MPTPKIAKTDVADSSPFRWVGGKSRLRKHIIPLLPEHTCYVELFCGAAWVLFGKPPSEVEIINDIDQDLTTFFRVVKDRPDELVAAFEWELVARAEFNRLRDMPTADLTEVQRAHRFYYLIMAGWGGELNYPRFSTSITDGGGGNRLVGALRGLRERLEPVHRRLQSVLIECLDWRECLDRYDRDGVAMYIDPPYPENGCNYANNMRDWASHEALASRLLRTRCKWICSSYDDQRVRAMFPGCHFVEITSASGMIEKRGGSNRVVNREILVLNYPPVRGAFKGLARDGSLFGELSISK